MRKPSRDEAESGPVESELTRLIEVEERLSERTEEARRAAEALVQTAAQEAEEASAAEAARLDAEISALRGRVHADGVAARRDIEAERTRRVALYEAVTGAPVRALADVVLDALTGQGSGS